MARRRNAHCRDCGEHRDTVGQISLSGLCAECGRAGLVASIDSQVVQSGDAFDRWVEAQRKAMRRYGIGA